MISQKTNSQKKFFFPFNFAINKICIAICLAEDAAGVSGEVLEETVLNIFDELGCSVSLDHIESCHRISKKSDTVIVKFSLRKDCQQVWQVKKDLQKLKMEDVDLTWSNKLFINRSLCPCYKVLWSKSKKLHNLGKIFFFFCLW